MFNSRFKLFLRTLRALRLSDTEKSAFRKELIEKMKTYPIQSAVSPRESSRRWFLLLHQPRFVAGMAIIALLVSTSGVSAAAERALPGETLYPMKTEFNERLADVFARMFSAEAEWDRKKIARRIVEAEALSKDGRLTPETQSLLESDINAHIADFEESYDDDADEDEEHSLRTRFNETFQSSGNIRIDRDGERVRIRAIEDDDSSEEDEEGEESEEDEEEDGSYRQRKIETSSGTKRESDDRSIEQSEKREVERKTESKRKRNTESAEQKEEKNESEKESAESDDRNQEEDKESEDEKQEETSSDEERDK